MAVTTARRTTPSTRASQDAPSGPSKARATRAGQRHAAIAKAMRQDATRLDREIRKITGADSPDLRRYAAQYDREVGKLQPEAMLRRAECVRRASRADIVFCSDIHSARGPQNVCRELLEQMQANGPVALVLEIAKTEHQKDLDQYLAGKLTLKALEKRLAWGFDFTGYGRLLEVAKSKGVPLIAANTRGTLTARDKTAADIIARAAADDPKRRLLVLFGKYHIGGGHLAKKTHDGTKKHGVSPKISRVLSGDHTSYFDLAAKGEYPQAVQFRDSTFCIFASTPRGSRKSYLRCLDRFLET